MRYCRILAAFVAFVAPTYAVTIVSVPNQISINYGLFSNSSTQVVATSWSQTGSYDNVSISAWLSANGTPSVTGGQAFLTRQIGPSTTASDFITSVSFGAGAFSSSNTTLFSGLSLGPGTYYLTIACPICTSSAYISWYLGGTPITTDTGASFQGGFIGALPVGIPPYFAAFTSAGASVPAFAVTGDPAQVGAVPEPLSAGLFAAGALVIALMRTRKP